MPLMWTKNIKNEELGMDKVPNVTDMVRNGITLKDLTNEELIALRDRTEIQHSSYLYVMLEFNNRLVNGREE